MNESKLYIIGLILACFIFLNSVLMMLGNIFLQIGKNYKYKGEEKKAISSFNIAGYFTPFYERIFYEWGYLLNKKGIKENNIQYLFDSIKLFETAIINNPGFYRAELLLLETKEYLRLLKRPFVEYLKELNDKYPNNAILNKILYNEMIIYERKEHLKKFKVKWLHEFKESMKQIDRKFIKNFFDIGGKAEYGNLYSNTEILLLVKIESKSGYIQISAKSSHVDGIYAKMEVSLNEIQLSEVFINSEDFSPYIFNFENQRIGDGILSISFTNDTVSEKLKQDRNLYINFVEIFKKNGNNKNITYEN